MHTCTHMVWQQWKILCPLNLTFRISVFEESNFPLHTLLLIENETKMRANLRLYFRRENDWFLLEANERTAIAFDSENVRTLTVWELSSKLSRVGSVCKIRWRAAATERDGGSCQTQNRMFGSNARRKGKLTDARSAQCAVRLTSFSVSLSCR